MSLLTIKDRLITVPFGPRGFKGDEGPEGPAGTGVTALEPRVDDLEVPPDDGDILVLGKYSGSSYELGGSGRNIRYNVELTGITNNIAGMCVLVEGLAYRASQILSLRFGGYASGSAISFATSHDLTGSSRPKGLAWSPNSKPYFWFEADNHLITFNVRAVRQGLGNPIDPGINVHLTEAGVTWS